MGEGQEDLELSDRVATGDRYYEQRANLLSRILDERQSEYDLVRDKLMVLQDVVQQQHHRQRKTSRTSSLSPEQNRTASLMVEELRRNLTVAEGLVGALQDKLDKAEHSLAKRKSEMQRQQLYYQSQIEELRKDLDLANLESGENSKAQSARVKQLQQRVHDLEDELRQTKARHSASLEGVRSSLDSKIAASRIQLEAVQRELSDVQALNADYKRQAAVWEERMEIAAASVRASERREEELLKYVEELEAVASSRNDTIRHLQAQIEDLQLELNNERNQTTSDLLVLSQADAIEDLEEQIRNLKHMHAAQLRSERKQFQQDINELQEDFQLKLDGMRVAAAASPTRAAEAAAAVAPSRSPANVARRAWQRMKRPFQRP